MTNDRWMDKAAVVHIYNGILLSHKKGYTWVSSNEADEPRAYYAEWSESEREKQISYINAYTRKLEKWYRWSNLQSRNKETDVENKCMDTKEETEWRKLGNWDWGVYMIAMMYKLMKTYCRAQRTLLNVVWWTEWEGSQKGRGYVYMFCVCMTGSGKD